MRSKLSHYLPAFASPAAKFLTSHIKNYAVSPVISEPMSRSPMWLLRGGKQLKTAIAGRWRSPRKNCNSPRHSTLCYNFFPSRFSRKPSFPPSYRPLFTFLKHTSVTTNSLEHRCRGPSGESERRKVDKWRGGAHTNGAIGSSTVVRFPLRKLRRAA